MPIEIQSTTDTPEAVATAKAGDLVRGKVIEHTETATEAKAPVETASESVTPEEKPIEHAEEHDGEVDGEAKDGQATKKKGGFKKRIDKLTGKLTAKEQEVEYWKAEALKVQKTGTPPTKVVETKPDPAGKPIADDFDTHEKYVDALTDWKLDQREQSRKAKDQAAQTQSEFQKKSKAHVERQQEFVKEHKDFDDLMDAVDDIPMSLTVQQVILDSENGPELMYELAKDRKEYERICKLSAIDAARALGKFEAKIAKTDAASAAETKTTKTPAPLKTVSGNTTTAPKGYRDDMPFKEFKKWRESGGGT